MSSLLIIALGTAAGLALVLLAVAIASAVGRSRFARQVHHEVRRLFSAGAGADFHDAPIDDARLDALPAPAARYLRWAGVLNKTPSRYGRLQQVGRFRTGPSAKWMPIAADQYYAMDTPGFVWFAVAQPSPVMHIRVRDRLLDGHGEIDGRLLSLIRVVHVEGDEVDQGVMLRYLSELVWLPSAFLSPCVSFAEVEDEDRRDSHARVSLRIGEREVSGELEVDEEGKPLCFYTERYYADGKSEPRLERWKTPCEDWGELGGFMVPTRGKAVWELAEGDFEYADLEILRIDHDVPSLFSEV